MPTKFLKVAPDSLVVTTDAYTANDVVGGLLTFSIDANFAIDGAILQTVEINDAANQKEAFDVWLFAAAPTTIANDAAFEPVIADLQKRIGNPIRIAAADYTTVNNLAYATTANLTRPLQFSGGKLYAYLVAVDTPDYAAAGNLSLYLNLISEGR